jgi:hypothetical protein
MDKPTPASLRNTSRYVLWRDAAVAFSLANLIFYRPLVLLLAMHSSAAYWTKVEPRPLTYVAMMSNAFLLTAFFFLTFRAIRRLNYKEPTLLRSVARAVIGLVLFAALLVLIVSAYVSTGNYPALQPFRHWWVLLIIGLVAALFPLSYWRGRRKPLVLAYEVLLVLLPLAGFTFGQAVLRCLTFDPHGFADKPLAPRLPTLASSPHVVWVIFDEWDPDLTFSDRASDLKLPEIDRLRQTAFYADSAATPALLTNVSIPALTIGAPVSSTHSDGPYDLSITSANGATTLWSSDSTVFSEARKLGMNTGIVGWDIPYCRVLSKSLTDCFWLTDMDYYDDDNMPKTMLHQVRTVLWEGPFRSPFGQAPGTIAHAWLYHQLFAKSKQFVSGQGCNLLLLHLPIPHAAFFYNRLTGKDDLNSEPFYSLFLPKAHGYLDALALVDRSIGELRRTMEAGGVWDSTTLLFSADHPFRGRPVFDGKPVGRHVPFLVKLAGQHQPLKCDAHFSALLTHDLILAVLKKEISTADELNDWILAHRDAFPAD